MEKNKYIQLTNNSTYREIYYNGGKLWFKGFFIGSRRCGYYEHHNLRLEPKPIRKEYYAR
jgi:hypothetical protein